MFDCHTAKFKPNQRVTADQVPLQEMKLQNVKVQYIKSFGANIVHYYIN
jgi:hypothetical protein